MVKSLFNDYIYILVNHKPTTVKALYRFEIAINGVIISNMSFSHWLIIGKGP
jgi:hypothetical protein